MKRSMKKVMIGRGYYCRGKKGRKKLENNINSEGMFNKVFGHLKVTSCNKITIADQ
jgi:hypothetical protein